MACLSVVGVGSYDVIIIGLVVNHVDMPIVKPIKLLSYYSPLLLLNSCCPLTTRRFFIPYTSSVDRRL